MLKRTRASEPKGLTPRNVVGTRAAVFNTPLSASLRTPAAHRTSDKHFWRIMTEDGPADESRSAEDSLDLVELVMAIEVLISPHVSPGQRERLSREIESLINPRLTPGQRERLIGEIKARIANGEFGDDDFDDDALAALVRKLGPRSPRGQAGAAARPEELFFE